MVVEEGHEVAHHGWVHEGSDRPEAENRRNLERGIEVLEGLAGAAPRGFREPGGHLENPMILLLQEYGFMWDSSLEASDYEVYYVRAGDRVGGEEGFTYGSEIDLLEMPSSWNLDDFPAFEFVWGFNAGLRSPSQVLEVWTMEFDFMKTHHPTGVFGPALHSQVIGRGHRLMMLDQLIQHMQGAGNVRFETVTDYMTRWKALHPEPEATLRRAALSRRAERGT
jgi:peptidoglycan/xylan/chitin deacetylase (PgdA/CDA1 family)